VNVSGRANGRASLALTNRQSEAHAPITPAARRTMLCKDQVPGSLKPPLSR